jgi:uncharacterized protein YjiS (DUF1127 family)
MPTTAQYPALPIAAGTLARVFAAVLVPVAATSKLIVRAVRNRQNAKVLAGLDRHMLADIGLTPSDVHDAFSAPLWQDPTTLLSERAIERRMNRAVIRVAFNAKNNAKNGARNDNAVRKPVIGQPARQAS